MLTLDEKNYTVTEKTYHGVKVREIRPIKTPDQDKKDREHATRMCISVLERFHKL